MINFKEWIAQNGIEYNKPWKANKEQIVKHWSSLPPNTPMSQVKLIPAGHKGSTMANDGLRITGSSEFIDSILSRLRELVAYEGGNSKLNVVYKQQIDSKTHIPIPGCFVFYFNVKQR